MNPKARFLIWLLLALAGVGLVLANTLPARTTLRAELQAAHEAREAGLPKSAAEHIRAAIALAPWRADLWEQLGVDELAAGAAEEGMAALGEAERRGGLTPAGKIALGDGLLASGDLSGAVTTWQTALAQNASADLYRRLCAALRGQGDWPAALDCARNWRAFDPGSAEADYLAGALALALENDQAMIWLLEAARNDPSFEPRVDILRKGFGQAMVAEQPARRLLLQGRAFGNAGEWELAQELFIRSISAAPDYAEAWAFLGEARQRLGADGQTELERALELDPQSLAARALNAVRLRRSGQYDQALATLDQIIAQEPDQGMWRVEAGAVMAEAGDLVRALEYFQSAARVEVRTVANWQALARFSVNYEVDIAGVGLPAARKATALAPNDPTSLDLMGWAFLKLGDLSSAERFLQRALAEDNRFATAHLHLGQVNIQQEQPEQARERFLRAAELDPDGPVGELARRLLERYYPGSLEGLLDDSTDPVRACLPGFGQRFGLFYGRDYAHPQRDHRRG